MAIDNAARRFALVVLLLFLVTNAAVVSIVGYHIDGLEGRLGDLENRPVATAPVPDECAVLTEQLARAGTELAADRITAKWYAEGCGPR